MKKNYNKNGSKFIKLINGKGFYAAIAICMLAIGVALWSAVDSFKQLNENLGGETSYTQLRLESELLNIQSRLESAESPIESESDAEKPQESEAQEAVETTNTVARFFVMPITGDISKNFSNEYLQYSDTYMDMRLHTATDIVASQGSIINSSGDGKVLEILKDAFLGEIVVIDHGNGIIAKYCGLKNISVKVGDTVSASQSLGEIGVIPSESVEAPHLHFEVTKDGVLIDPLSLMTVN